VGGVLYRYYQSRRCSVAPNNSQRARAEELQAEYGKLVADAVRDNPDFAEAIDESLAAEKAGDLGVKAEEYFTKRWKRSTKPG
jgi:hypothetical protein